MLEKGDCHHFSFDQLKQGFDKLYAYTNSKDSGIIHDMIENGIEPDFDDAKYMLIS